MIGRLLLMLLSLAGSPCFANAENDQPAFPKRVALVIGNGIYEDSAAVLENPANDATAIAAKLRGLGIEVIEAVDLDYKEMRDTLRKFDRALQGADAGLFYYAGHAMEYRGQNYLFPTDAILETEGDVGLGLIDIDQVLQVMETAVPTRLVFLDACRNNPLAHNFRRSLGASREASVGQGLARIQTAVGTFIAYATAPGDVAADGKDQNSPFTAAVLKHVDEPGLEISQLMQRVRNSVIETTDEGQVPWDSSSLRGPFILNLNVTINPTSDGVGNAEMIFWKSIKDSNRLAEFDAYLERFGDEGVFAPLARTRVVDLKRKKLAASENALNMNRHEIQLALLALGYDTGAADGIFGSLTRAALQEWQQDNEYETTAYLSKEQMDALLESVPNVSEITMPLSTKSELANASSVPTTHLAKRQSIMRYENECAKGDQEACNRLAYAYKNGVVVGQDFDRAESLYKRSCSNGNQDGCNSLFLLQTMRGRKTDRVRAELRRR